jgi:hypothetical protein
MARKITPEQYLANLKRERAAVEDSLARPVAEGAEWDRQRAALTRREAELTGQIAYAAFVVRLKRHVEGR